MNRGNNKKIALINDISGFGRCSITVSLPIISKMKIQACPLPTSIFSNHTGYPEYFFDDYTDKMQEYADKWKRLGISFDGIMTGFLGSVRQIEIVRKFISDFKKEGTYVIVDPIMGDHGKAYATYTEEMCSEMKKLVAYADILTPNLTEACILTDTPYGDGKFKVAKLKSMADKLVDMGAGKVVISGITMGSYVANIIYDKDKGMSINKTKRVGCERAGTGDVFSAIIAADCVNGVDFVTSVKKASTFVKSCLQVTEEMNIPPQDGVCFEYILDKLR